MIHSHPSRRQAVASLLALAGVLTSCGGTDSAPAAFTDVTMTHFRPFASGEYVIRSRAELQAAWQAAPFRLWPVGLLDTEPAFPEYDYGTSMLVGLSLGSGPWCFAPRIQRVRSDGHDTEVEYVVPTSSTLACLRDGPLIAFALVPRAAGTLHFSRVDG